MIKEINFQKTIEEAFLAYGASVAQERAIPDVRDGLKIGLRQGLYAQFSNGLTSKDKYQKAQKSVAAAMTQSYVHGDVAMYDTFIRAAKPWAYRYPIEDAQGAVGSPSSPDDHSAARYVEMRAGELSNYFFNGLKKNAIKEWYDNYDDTEKIPSVFPSVGFWNVINGSTGIAVAMVTSVPQFNIRETNNALVKIIKNPEISFDEIYCVPDFATGGYIINPDEVKNGMKVGEGANIKLRAKLEYFKDENYIQATELPYGIYTNTIMSQLANLTDADEFYGIKKVIDYTKKNADIRIYLQDKVDSAKMIKKLYNDTDLESSFSINMTMLDKGRFPKVFGWKEACDAYIAHIRECKRNEIEYDRDQAIKRKNILTGLIIAATNIDDVVKIIRSSSNQKEAAANLIKAYSLNDEQVKSILSMRLSSLTKMDLKDLKDEDIKNDAVIKDLNKLLSNPLEIDEILINILQEVADKYGDDRRTKILEISPEESETEPAENKCVIFYSNNTFKIVSEELAIKNPAALKSSLKDVFILKKETCASNSSFYVVSNAGKCYKFNIEKIKNNIETSIYSLVKIDTKENIIEALSDVKLNANTNLLIVTEKGTLKKIDVQDILTISNKTGVSIINLKDEDKVIDIHLSNSDTDEAMIFTNKGNYVRFYVSDISCVGRNAGGVKAIKIDSDTKVVSFVKLDTKGSYDGIITLSSDCKVKITKVENFPQTSRAIKGNGAIKLNDSDELISAGKIYHGNNIITLANGSKIDTSFISVQNRLTSGNKISIKVDKILDFC